MATATAASFADLRPTLTGRTVRIEPLAARHEAGLRAAAADPRVWRWMPYDPTGSDGSFHAWMVEALERAEAGLDAPFCILRTGGGEPLGSSRYLALRPEHRGLEIGWTWLSPAAWGTAANAEAKLLLMEHAFERLGCMRVEFKTDALNERSRAALEAIGARFEGIHRRHMLVRAGELRDSAWYSVIDDDWPATKAALAERVARKEAEMSERLHHSSGTEWEARIGYARAIRVGDSIHVSGTLGVGPDGRPPDGAYAQAVASLQRIGAALEALGSSLDDVVRTRMFVVDVEANQLDVGRAHSEFFADVRPASTMLGVAGFVGPEYLVEIEADAIASSSA